MTVKAQPRLWTADFVLTLLGTFSFFGSFFYLISVLPDYIDHIGGSKWQVGLIVGGFSVVPIVLRPFAGRWSDRGRRKRLMRVGLLSMVASLALMVFSEDVLSLFALRMVQGIGVATYPTAAVSMVAEVAPVQRRGEGLGFFGMAAGAAQMVTPALGVAIVGIWGFDAVFILAAVTAAVTLLIVQPVREPAPHDTTAEGGSNTLFPRGAIFPMTIFFTVTLAFTAAATFLPLLGDERGLGNVGLFFVFGGAANVITRPLAGRGSDRLGRMVVVLPALGATVVSMWLLALAEQPLTMMVAGLISGTGLGAAHTGLLALAVDRVSTDQRGRATAVFQLAWDFSGAAGGVVLGVLASGLDVASVFWFSGAVVLVALIGVGSREAAARVATAPVES